MTACYRAPMPPAQQTSSDCLIVIFGASGDLTKRKLVPGLYELKQGGKLPEHYGVLGISRSKYTDDSFREHLHDFKEDAYGDDWDEFASHIHYFPSDATDGSDWPDIKRAIQQAAELHGTGQNLLFYLSVGPQHFNPIIANIATADLVTEGKQFCSIGERRPWQRIIVEKPFGHDPGSARKLNDTLAQVFDEDSVYRIDHYLAKELVQNLMVLRFANSIFEPLWNHQQLDHVQITASETVGVEGRGGYYDGPAGGAMRDMVQSHLLQVLSLVAMEPPVSMEADDIRTEKIKVFKALRVPSKEQVPQIAVRGQYGGGEVNGETIPAYRDEDGTDADSQKDTFAAWKVFVDTWRWGGTPFYLRSGKAMAEKKTEIVLYFKPTPHCLFREAACDLKPNQIVINVQPDEGIRLRFEGKVPGTGLRIGDVVMDFDYVDRWQEQPPDAYALLLHDAMRGDQTLFKHRDEIEASWRAVQPVLDYWAEHPQDDLPNYKAGTWGPDASEAMMRRDGRYWRNG